MRRPKHKLALDVEFRPVNRTSINLAVNHVSDYKDISRETSGIIEGDDYTVVDIAAEYYAAVMNDQASKGPLIMFSTEGGMDIEEVAASHPDKLVRLPVDIRKGVDRSAIETMLAPVLL